MDGQVIIGTELDTKEFEDDLDSLEDEVESRGETSGKGFANGFKKGFGKIGNKITSVFSKALGVSKGLLKVVLAITSAITKMGLALGVAGGIVGLILLAFNVIAKAIENVSQKNEQVKTDLKYIVFAINKALEPAINFVANMIVQIIKLLIKAIQYVAVFIKMLTGKNIFANASVEAFAESLKEAENNSSGVAKNLKEAKKQLAGFDEMEVLQDTSSSGGGDIGGISTPSLAPSFDLSDLTNAEAEVTGFFDRLKVNILTAGEMIKLSNTEWIDAFGKWGIVIKGITEVFYGLWEFIDGFFNAIIGLVKIVVGVITGDTTLIKEGIIDLLEGIWKMIDGLFNVIKGIVDIIVGLVVALIVTIIEWTEKMRQKIHEIVNAIFGFIVDFIAKKIQKFNEFRDKVVAVWITIKEKIKGIITSIYDFITEKFKAIGHKVGDLIGNGIKSVVNSILGFAEDRINGFLKSINKAIDIINKIPGVNIGKLKMVSFPKLAKGGIVNMPGRGVPVGNAIAGERGAEGVIPLTDSQQMALLGEAIGRYISINATVPVYVGNRQIARELRKINAEDDFAFNK